MLRIKVEELEWALRLKQQLEFDEPFYWIRVCFLALSGGTMLRQIAMLSVLALVVPGIVKGQIWRRGWDSTLIMDLEEHMKSA